MPQTSLDDLSNFNIVDAHVAVWAFKHSMKGGVPSLSAHWINVTPELQSALRSAFADARSKITEIIQYDILAQNNEGSALEIDTAETDGATIVAKTANQTPNLMVKRIEHLRNSSFYAVKFTETVSVNPQTIYAVRKPDDSWRSRKAKGVLEVVYVEDRLTLQDNPGFNISKYFDFYIINSKTLVKEKAHFESALSYKQAHLDEFEELQKEIKFKSLFSTLAPLLAYVGNNKMQLRRAFAIRQKGYYNDPVFMANLHANYRHLKLNINFDAAGRIIPCADTCKDIFQALLDHRLTSSLSKNTYDVQSTAPV